MSWLFPHYLFKKKIFVYIDILYVVLGLKCIRLKYMLETINYNNIDPVI